MTTRPERRHVARLPIPSQFGSPGQEDQPVHLCDLSPEGACIEHVRPLPDWETCFVELPLSLGGVRLQGEVVWSRVGGHKPGAEGKSRVYYQSGLHFTVLTPEQQAGLMAALELLKTTQEAPPPERPTGTAEGAPGESGRIVKDRA
jgi:hypothetical protein